MKKYNWTNKIIICKKLPYSIEEFLGLCVTHWTRTELSKVLNCSEKTIGLVIKNQVPELMPSTAPLGKRVLALLGLKRCSSCKTVTEPYNFHVDKVKKDGRTSACIKCRHASERVYRLDNPEKIAAKTAKRRAAKINRTPSWANEAAIEEVYKNCPEGHEVDHIIPLQGELVSGFHVETNLQYLIAAENRTKSNKYEV